VYFSPMEIVLDDVEEVVGCRVGLPGLEEEEGSGGKRAQGVKGVDGVLEADADADDEQTKADSVTDMLEAARLDGGGREIVKRKPVAAATNIGRGAAAA